MFNHIVIINPWLTPPIFDTVNPSSTRWMSLRNNEVPRNAAVYHQFPHDNWLVVDLPLWKIWRIVSWDDELPIYYGKIKFMFQTTNQMFSLADGPCRMFRHNDIIIVYSRIRTFAGKASYHSWWQITMFQVVPIKSPFFGLSNKFP